MRVRYSYLQEQFNNCPGLWGKLKRFVSKFSSLTFEKVRVAKSQNINKEILANTLSSKI